MSADSVDFLEDTAINLLILVALGWSLWALALAGKTMAVIIPLPALAAAWQAFTKFGDPVPPDPLVLGLTAGGAVLVNLVCSFILARFRNHEVPWRGRRSCLPVMTSWSTSPSSRWESSPCGASPAGLTSFLG